MTTIELRCLSKTFGTLTVIPSLDLDIGAGEFVALVGPSGCGKSTLLRMIAGLESISGGELSIGGQRMNEVPPKDRDIAMVFQSYALYPHMTVAENMAFSLRLRGASTDEKQRKVAAAAQALGLSQLLTRYPRELSGGQRQRVAMGRAIVRDPKVFLFDEPLSNLDAKLRVHTRAEIKALHQRLNTTTVYVTHDQIEAMTMADRIVVMNQGRIEQSGAPLDLYDHPMNMFVAGFLGSPAMNFLTGHMDGTTGVFTLASGQNIDLPAGRWQYSGPAVLGIRPEHITLQDGSGLIAHVQFIEPTGAETHLSLTVDGQPLTAVIRDRSLPLREEVSIAFQPDHIHLFDAETETSLPTADISALAP